MPYLALSLGWRSVWISFGLLGVVLSGVWFLVVPESPSRVKVGHEESHASDGTDAKEKVSKMVEKNSD